MSDTVLTDEMMHPGYKASREQLEHLASAHEKELLAELQGVTRQKKQRPKQPANVVTFDQDTGREVPRSRIDGMDAVRAGNACASLAATAYARCRALGNTDQQIRAAGGGRAMLAKLEGQSPDKVAELKQKAADAPIIEETPLEVLDREELRKRFEKVAGHKPNGRLGVKKLIEAIQQAQAEAAKADG